MGDLSKPKTYGGQMEEEMFELLSCKMGEVPELVCVDVVLEGSKEGKTGKYLTGKKSTTSMIVVTEELLNWLDSQASNLESTATATATATATSTSNSTSTSTATSTSTSTATSTSTSTATSTSTSTSTSASAPPPPPTPHSLPTPSSLRSAITCCIKSSPGLVSGRTFSSLPPPHLSTLLTLGLLSSTVTNTSATTSTTSLTLTLPCSTSIQKHLQSSRRKFVIALHASYHKEMLQSDCDRKYGEWVTWTGVGEGWWGWKEVSGGRGMYYLLN
ncbi:hypothetical protein TrCOL_g11466 [Triparma columacea]|uniref:Uncharacterized protein n=1 Tax=Triparma columacea TaxID=722753 RepID=A0A9W7G5B8_9STRA|nr:hypothetical protein TrCOL_g11466 [Triparma columacea]